MVGTGTDHTQLVAVGSYKRAVLAGLRLQSVALAGMPPPPSPLPPPPTAPLSAVVYEGRIQLAVDAEQKQCVKNGELAKLYRHAGVCLMFSVFVLLCV